MVTTPIPSGADFGIRFLARGLDLIFGFLLSLATGFASGIIFVILSAVGLLPEHWQDALQTESGNPYGLGIVASFLYHAFSEGIAGTTLGKLVCGLNVVQLDGRPCTMLGAFKRDLVYYLDGIFFGLVAYESMKKSSLQQRHGDVWGKTVVVRKAIFLPNPKHSAWRVAVGILIGSLAWMGTIFGSLLIHVL